VLRVSEHLRQAGHQVLIVAPTPGPADVAGVPIVRVPSMEMKSWGDLHVGLPSRLVTSALKDFAPDVVHVAAPVVLGPIALRSARRLGIPTVAVYQTDLAGFAERYGLGRASTTVWRWLSWVHRQADLTLAPSTAAVWDLRRRGVERVALWARGVDTRKFDPRWRSTEVHDRYAPGGEVLVGFVGRLAKEKQVERLRDLQGLPGVRLVVVGDGPVRADLEQVLPQAMFTGFLSGDDLSRHVASLDVFVHTGVDETFCQAVQEALAAGVPVVAPAAGGPLDLVRHGVNGYLWSPASPVSLVGAVEELVRSPMQREQMGSAARAMVEHRTWPAVMAELEGHYRSVIGGLAFAYAQVGK
jgi:phosphatidylinositol alpha 1,6-mannosyltransferase